jgi:exodeoxyribonuclease-3
MRIISWNINGIRAATKKGFLNWFHETKPDILGVQEVRALHAQIDPQTAQPEGWHTHFSSAKRPGYSGVGLYSRHPWAKVETSLENDLFDIEGRVQIAHVGELIIANVYFPNGNGKDRDNSRIPYKLDFYTQLFNKLEPYRTANQPLLVMGDFNTAHQEIDLARPKENVKTSGFCPEERAELDRWLGNGYVDTFRHFEKAPGNYTWWSHRAGSRERNVGWRIDYVLASESAMRYIKSAFIWSHVSGSDHCPVGVELTALP